MTNLETKINELFQRGGSHYLTGNKKDGSVIKIRVSDHTANSHNNDSETISLISELNYYGHDRMSDEFVVTEYEGTMYIDDLMKTLEQSLISFEIESIVIYGVNYSL